ncbi:hypothetical protein XELAEV_18015225mg [Xenopus laevis]|uniref:Helix-turn-helix domain-containing protein n=1 Tax=Xenopus laevis TaxID=8355 RepID=A0A974DJE6_XENLA|nr:hypothetical protein XELAEV_18015225mg [Xenopus laevis]
MVHWKDYTFLNGMEVTLKFTSFLDKISLSFLDVQITRIGPVLDTNLFRKETDRNDLLHYSSFHPDSLKASLPLTQYMRLKRIVSKEADYKRGESEMKDRFKQRDYPEEVLRSNLDKLQNKSREELLTPAKRDNKHSERLAFVSNYTTASRQVGNIIRKHWHLLQSCHPDITAFQDKPLLSYKHGMSLKDQLVRAEIGSTKGHKQQFLQNPKFGTFPCLHCVQCNSVIKGNSFFHPQTGKKYLIRNYCTCESTYVIYVIYLLKCPCGLLYIGETTQKIRDRICKHKSTIRRDITALPVPAHFHAARHSVSQLKFQIIDSVDEPRRGGARLMMLKKLEMQWIHKLDTIWPRGLNREYTLCYVYVYVYVSVGD